jgi:tetratricopeptide (TPR) repeat protein
MKRTLLLIAALTAFGCAEIRDLRNSEPPYQNPFYAKYLNTGSSLDAQIHRVLAALRADERNPQLHNELGALLVSKGFPKDAEREFERAINADSRFHPAWYNLGLVRAARNNFSGARRAFFKTTRLVKGHSEALFQLGLMEERRGNRDAAIAYYAKALRHNPRIVDVRTNPLVLDSKLIHLAILQNYDRDHLRLSSSYLGTPDGYVPPPVEAPKP